ncbi:leucine-rich repeat-containing protein 24 [Procambarus clarkii]|uniref:leucine-rich repeat-containing protein 24 n=1 Tax=Procambarus clarkii TaxID=6728 RepID=UPI001E67889C|nr:leucine-rich repeat-containing protein 24-like [Procambarus clarkii]
MRPPSPVVQLTLLLAAAATASDCPSFCSCKWKHGKQTAECHRKDLHTLPTNIDPATQVLDLSHNNIQRLPRLAFAQEGLTNLQKIYLTDCNLQEVDNEAFGELSNLVELDLSDNQLKQVPSESFRHTPELRELYLSGNPIHNIDLDTFTHLSSLKTLDISKCSIRTIAARAFEPLRMLEKLKLASNRLTELQPRLVDSLQNLHQLTVHENPWFCDCRLRKLREWLVVRRVPHTVSPVCAKPLRIQGLNFDEIDEDEFACPPEILPTTRRIEGVAGVNTTVWCPVGGLPTPAVSWHVRDTVVHNGSSVGVGGAHGYILNEASEERGSLLLLVGTRSQDSGLVIRCVASNAAGTASATFELAVAQRSSASFSPDKIAAISSVLVVVAAILIGVLSVLARRRRHAHTPIPIKTVTVNGATEARIADLPYTPSAYVGGSVVATTDNPDLLCEADQNSEGECCTTDDGSQHSTCSVARRHSHAVSLDGDKAPLGCPFDSVWEPERVHAVLDSAAPEHVMHTSLHEPLTPSCDALVQQRLLSSSQRHLNNRLSYLPDFAPDYSELYSFSQVGSGHTSLSGVPVPHYGTIPRSIKTRAAVPELVPGDGTPTLTRHPRAWHYGSEGSPAAPIDQQGGYGAYTSSPPTSRASTCVPQQPLHSHSNKLSRITARDSPDEGYQEGADV